MRHFDPTVRATGAGPRRRSNLAHTAVFIAVLYLALVPCAQSAVRRESLLRRVSVSSTSVNFSAGEMPAIAVTIGSAARLDVQVIDRDGFVIRTLPSKNGAPGKNSFIWDGKDDRGAVVPDEAYSFRVVAGGGLDEYFPASQNAAMTAITPLSYSRTTSTLTYVLEKPSRVHVQAGTIDAKAEGPVLKTIVDRQPRDGGRVAEHWSGFDESGGLYVPDLPGFALAIAATPLPENSVITYGNAKQPFLAYAAHRTGASLFRHHARAAHHAGLDVFNDLAPHLSLTFAGHGLRLRADGPTAEAFLRQPGKIFLFVDSKLVATFSPRKAEGVLNAPLPANGEHVVVVNWRSDYGPVAVAVAKARSGARP